MRNLIKNSKWAPGPTGSPQYFSGVGPITYDKVSIDGYRPCSITMIMPGNAQDYYDLLINVMGHPSINFGYTIRAITADYIYLVAEFTDRMRMPITTTQKNITNKISHDFQEVLSKFTIPSSAAYVKLSIKFMGRITACTYYAPVAYFG